MFLYKNKRRYNNNNNELLDFAGQFTHLVHYFSITGHILPK